MNPKLYYNSVNRYLKDRYGEEVRKIGLNAGFTCPNRDGDIGFDGCVFCNEAGFSQFPQNEISVHEQIESSIKYFFDKKGIRKFIAYFQNAAGTNASVKELKNMYDVIKEYKEIVALTISTRPDCVDDEKLDLINEYTDSYEVWMEYGMQTSLDVSLEKVRRRHTFKQSLNAIRKTAERGINVGVHIILGLPGETYEDMIATAKILAKLPVNGIKLHTLHVLKDTELEQMYRKGDLDILSEEEYVRITCDFLENLRSDQVILRLISDAKDEYLIAPDWMRNKIPIIREINVEFKKRGTCQGSKWSKV